ncbi:ABC transporter permease subunit [Paenibacillus qinlingensis]|uniref:Aldouronate transport system permease protein n=1 Tax=Paenibacillus qinlingensis TaxID=1837343 RepID=A0ABU1NWA6_9BACL|nr:ABC transporter permease subunit [Paenibacillus qinlingensis]MDR6551758.1 putative aldouronate transport system permease protein [Paenibacillus qinlingensis]
MMTNNPSLNPATIQSKKRGSRRLVAIRHHKFYYLLILPGLLYFLIFDYVPMAGIVIAFKDISPFDGIQGIISSPWVGFKHFKNFMDSIYFWNVLRNTLVISGYKLIIGFPAPIILALLLNEVKHQVFKKFVQTISYLPHFLSMVIISGLVMNILSTDGGLVNELLRLFGKEPIHFLGSNDYFRSVLVSSHIWHQVGWGSILYLAALTAIDPQLYEAAIIDGAGKWRQVWHITLPGITHVIVILFIFNVGGLLNAGFEQVFLLYSPPVYETSDIIDTFVYRQGLIQFQYSFATAVNLFKSVFAAILILGTNYLSKRLGQEGIW